MRFTCDKCSAKYTIADEKVRGKIVAVKCSKCGNKITVNGKTLVVPEEIPEERTRVASLTDLDALRAQEAQAAAPAPAPAKAAPPPPPPPPPPAKAAPEPAAESGPHFSEGWHAIIDRQQIGPLTPAELRKHLAGGKLTARTYVWRDGQGDWKRASDIPEFATALAPKQAPAPAPVPAPAPAPVPASARNSVSIRGKPAPKNGSHAAAVQAKAPVENDFEMEDRPTVQRSDLDVAALAKLAREGEEAPDAGANENSEGATQFDPELGTEGPGAAAAAPGNLFDDPAQEPAAAAAAAASAFDPDPAMQEPPAEDAAPRGDLKSMLFDDDQEPVTGSHSKPIDLANEVAGELDRKADPFSKVPDNPNISKPGEIGEKTRFFMNKAGVTRRNPPWKIALFVVLLFGLPVGVLYALSLYKVEFLQIQTGVDDSGHELKASVFTSEGLSTLKDVLLKKKPAVAPKPKPKPKPPTPNPVGDGKKPDESGGQVVAKADIKFDTLTDEQRKAMADATKDVGDKTPKVDPTLLESKLHVDGAAGLDAKVVGEVFAKNIKAFQACVETELRRNPAFKGGKVNIAFTIGSSGVVTKASLDRPDLEGTELGTCLKKRARVMVFPSFEGEPFDVESPLIMAKGM